MDDFVTIASFTQPYQVHIIQSRMIVEGIDCRLQDEFMAYTQLYSTAVSGIKLQVRRQDYERAKAILVENGYRFDPQEKIPKWFIFLSETTRNIPLIGNLTLGKRVFILLAILLILIAAPFYFLSAKK